MTESEEKARLVKLRDRVMDMIDACDCIEYGKSYEGEMTVSLAFPSYWDRREKVRWSIRLDCYLLGPARHYVYDGKTLTECMDKLEKDLDEWSVGEDDAP